MSESEVWEVRVGMREVLGCVRLLCVDIVVISGSDDIM